MISEIYDGNAVTCVTPLMANGEAAWKTFDGVVNMEFGRVQRLLDHNIGTFEYASAEKLHDIGFILKRCHVTMKAEINFMS